MADALREVGSRWDDVRSACRGRCGPRSTEPRKTVAVTYANFDTPAIRPYTHAGSVCVPCQWGQRDQGPLSLTGCVSLGRIGDLVAGYRRL
jgi:hypothetical protein